MIVINEFDDYKFSHSIVNLRKKLPELRKIYVVGKYGGDALSRFSKLERPCNIKELQKQITHASDKITTNTVSLILYTSGTTGSPKGVMLSTRNIVTTLSKINKKVKARSSDRFLLVVPITSSLGCVTTMLRAMLEGCSLVLMQQFKAPAVLDVIDKKEVTIKVGVPTMFILELMELDKTQKYRDLSSLRQSFISGSECPAEIMYRIENKMGCQVMIGYGLTESTSYITVTNPEDSPEVRQKTVGSPLPGEEFKVIDENGKQVSKGPGEILVRGNSVMMGYFKNPEKTAEDIDNEGWFHTGDLGQFDEKNNLIFLGRKKDLIIRGGFNIYVSEIEDFLLKHQQVANAALVGVPDSVLGERSVACIITKPNYNLSEEDILAFCSSNLSDYKVPDYVCFFEEFPLTHNGKVKKVLLKQELLKKIELK